jgi:hypothetical protein
MLPSCVELEMMAEEEYEHSARSAVSSHDETDNDDLSRASRVLSLRYSSSPFIVPLMTMKTPIELNHT